MKSYRPAAGLFILSALAAALLLGSGTARAAQSNGSVGLQGSISAPPPTKGASITIPGNGQRLTDSPIKVAGICPNDLLVKVFKNNVFAGSVMCSGGTFSITVDLFSGQNDLVARVYDSLDQAGPDSNTVTVTYNDARLQFLNRVTLTSNYAKRGSFPGQKLTWPIILSGGTGPYAVSVDWGDGKNQQLKPVAFAGEFDIDHTYDSPGVYNVIVKVTDSTGQSAFLQVVAVTNGALGQTQDQKNGTPQNQTIVKVKVIWWPVLVLFPFILLGFWLGRRTELLSLRRRLSGRPR
jgi:hypothetical protein